MRYDLLREALLPVIIDRQRRDLTLPGVLHQLSVGDIESFEGLQSHQEHGWYAFLVQLAAIAMPDGANRIADLHEAGWCSTIERLTEARGGAAAWHLVVEDQGLPAFMQPPVPAGTYEQFEKSATSPASGYIDLLVTSKQHDVKDARVHKATPAHWVYALVALQTMEGYTGRHPPQHAYRGISRMNGGFASRPVISAVPSHSYGARFRRDQALAARMLPRLTASYGFDADGLALVWTEPWDGETSIPFSGLHPYYIETCRRVRLVDDPPLRVLIAPSVSSRMTAPESGDTGDLWTPLRKDNGAALTLSARGFTYRLVHGVLFATAYEPSPSQLPQEDDPSELVLVGKVLVRGQGETGGLHELHLPVPGWVARKLMSPEARARVGRLAEARVQRTSDLQRKVLHPALCMLLQGAPPRANLKDDRTSRWIDCHEARINDLFFPALWRDLELPEAERTAAWDRLLVDVGEEVLEQAIAEAPLPEARRFRAIAGSERIFFGAARRHFAAAFRPHEEDSHEPACA